MAKHKRKGLQKKRLRRRRENAQKMQTVSETSAVNEKLE